MEQKQKQKQNEAQQDESRYLTTVLPKSGSAINRIVDKYRTLRLEALAETPESWSSSFEIEEKLPFSYFVDLVTQPRRHIVVIVERPWASSNTEETLVDGKWVGFVHAVGPVPLSEWTWPNLGGLRPDEEEARWSCFTVYLVAEYRGSKDMLPRFEKRTIKLCVDETRRLLGPKARKEGRKTLLCRQRCSVVYDHTGLVRTYTRLGLRKTGFITLGDSLRAQEPSYKRSEEAEGDDLVMPDRIALERVFLVETGAAGDETRIRSVL